MMTESEQLKCFRKGFPWLEITSPAIVGHGILRLSERELEGYATYSDNAEVAGRCKFVPASGAASRMFKDIFARDAQAIGTLARDIEKFAFYDRNVFGKAPFDPESCAKALLDDDGLGYGCKPKAVLKFHRYPNGETRTALAEHLVEGKEYARDADGTVHITFTISPEHRELFETALSEVKAIYEARYGVRYDIDFTCQDKETDTIAVNPDNTPFIKDDGTVLKRPAGHGALISNLSSVPSELVFIKNIDNISVESLLETTALYKKALAGLALTVRDRIFGYLITLDQMTGMGELMDTINPYIPGYNCVRDNPYSTPECLELYDEIEEFLTKEMFMELPAFANPRERAMFLRAKLNRPIRVCGMVPNTGEPGGGPFFTKNSDGSVSLQILEGSQIDPDNQESREMLSRSTHFNPVDIVCCTRDYRGRKFRLEDYVDMDTCFISSKSYQGRPLKALELPGLWNGAMSDWNTIFVEVPIETFNPVKVVLDLLRPNHQ